MIVFPNTHGGTENGAQIGIQLIIVHSIHLQKIDGWMDYILVGWIVVIALLCDWFDLFIIIQKTSIHFIHPFLIDF